MLHEDGLPTTPYPTVTQLPVAAGLNRTFKVADTGFYYRENGVVGWVKFLDLADIPNTAAPAAVLSASSPVAGQSVPSAALTALDISTNALLDAPIFTRLSATRIRANLAYPTRFDFHGTVNYAAAGAGNTGTARTLRLRTYRAGALNQNFQTNNGQVANADSVTVGGTMQLQDQDEIELLFQHDTTGIVGGLPQSLLVSCYLMLSQIGNSPDQAVVLAQQFAATAAAAALAAQGSAQTSSAAIQAVGAISRGRSTNQAVVGSTTAWTTVLLDVAVFADAASFGYESATGAIIPSLIDQERLDLRMVVRFAAAAGGTIRKLRVIAENPANASDFTVPLSKEVAPSASVDSVIDISGIILPNKNWKLKVQVQHDYLVATVGQTLNVTGAVVSLATYRGRQGPAGVAVRETINNYPFVSQAGGQASFSIPDPFDDVLMVIAGGSPQQPDQFTRSGQNIVLNALIPVGTKVSVIVASNPPGQASLLRVMSGVLAANATQIALPEPIDLVLFVGQGGVLQAPSADFNVNYPANRVDLVSGLAFSTGYLVVYRRLSPSQ